LSLSAWPDSAAWQSDSSPVGSPTYPAAIRRARGRPQGRARRGAPTADACCRARPETVVHVCARRDQALGRRHLRRSADAFLTAEEGEMQDQRARAECGLRAGRGFRVSGRENALERPGVSARSVGLEVMRRFLPSSPVVRRTGAVKNRYGVGIPTKCPGKGGCPRTGVTVRDRCQSPTARGRRRPSVVAGAWRA
jgi:hypothetical protein